MNSHPLLVEMKNGTATLEASWAVPYKTKYIFLPQVPAIMLPGIYLKELKTYVHTKTYTQMFIAAYLEATKMFFSRPQINKLWYIQKMEYYSGLKRNELSSYEKMWRKLKCLLLSERSQSENAVYCMIPTI